MSTFSPFFHPNVYIGFKVLIASFDKNNLLRKIQQVEGSKKDSINDFFSPKSRVIILNFPLADVTRRIQKQNHLSPFFEQRTLNIKKRVNYFFKINFLYFCSLYYIKLIYILIRRTRRKTIPTLFSHY